MRSPTPLTIVARLKDGVYEQALEHLKEKVNPRPDGAEPSLRFSVHKTLHFVSFCLVPDEGPDMPAQLVMEATVDGPEDAFIKELVRRDGGTVRKIFSFCEGLDASQPDHLVETWLLNHRAPYQTFFSGAPGRTVETVRFERRLRRWLRERIHDIEIPAGPPRFFLDAIRDYVARTEVFAGAMAPHRPLWSVANGGRVLGALGLCVVLALIAIGALLFYAVPGLEGWWGLAASLGPLDVAALKITVVILAARLLNLAAGWARGKLEEVNPSGTPLIWLGLANLLLLPLRFLLLIWGVALAFTIGAAFETWVGLPWIFDLILFAAIGLVACVPLLLMRLMRISAAHTVAGPPWAKPEREPIDAWIFSLVYNAVLIFKLSLIAAIAHAVIDVGVLEGWAAYLVGAAGRISAALILLILIWPALLVWHQERQKAENRLFDEAASKARDVSDPNELLTVQMDRGHITSREEHGYNRTQNHYISLTHVKPGWARRWLLRFVLWLVNFLAIYKFNTGHLGGIPTIFSARWVLLDNDRRLLFLTNYSGAWDSYLNEFSELGGVIGVNMIWTNTYISTGPGMQGVRFPNTEWFTGKGARSTLPFKAYVRRSQRETLAWYGAYRDLSVVNVSDNADLRAALSDHDDPSALDRIMEKL